MQTKTENVIAFDSNDPIAEHHILIIPKKHIESTLEIGPGDKNLVFEMTEVVQKLVKKKGIEGGYKLAVNGGKYQFVPHLHWHLLAGNLGDIKDAINQT